MDYLFWIWDHEQLGGGSTNFNKILEEGFMDAYDLLVSYYYYSHI